MNRLKPNLSLVCLFSLALSAAASAQTINTSASFPTLTTQQTVTLASGLFSDSPGSTLIDTNGKFYYISTVSDYTTTDKGESFIKTIYNSDLGEMNYDFSSSTTTTYDTFPGTSGTYCYEIDKRSTDPIESPLEDDHCDVVGVWVDASTGTWYGIVHDEYYFNPWSTTDRGDVTTGIHFDRIMYATSTNQGTSWQLQDPIITSPFGDTASTTAFPGNTWYFGDGDPRLFVDYSTGYFYVFYYSRIFNKSGSRLASFPNVARAPISGKMAVGSWNKWYDGGWLQPGVGGQESIVGMNKPGTSSSLTNTYNPSQDTMTIAGTAPDGTSFSATSFMVSNGSFTFSDPTTSTAYSINVSASSPTITNVSDSSSVSYVSYVDKQIHQQVIVQIVSGTPQITFVDQDTGAQLIENINSNEFYYKNDSTQGLYGGVGANGATVAYNTALNTYMGVDDPSLAGDPYEGGSYKFVWESTDLGNEDGWNLIGQLPSGSSYGYYDWLMDDGSLANNNVAGLSFRRYDVSKYDLWDFSLPSSVSGYSHSAAPATPVDSTGTAISSSSTYTITQAAAPAQSGTTTQVNTLTGSSSTWKFVPVPDPFTTTANSGFYRIENTGNSEYLFVTSSSSGGTQVYDKRALNAKVGEAAAQSNADPQGLSGSGEAGHSDEWYFEPIANDVPATLTSSSQPASATNTTINTSTKVYKIVNRDSGLVLDFSSGSPILSPNHFAADTSNSSAAYRTNLAVTITPTK